MSLGRLIFLLFLHVFDRNLSYVETLPNGSDGILRNEWIRGQDGEFMLDGLANEHAVKRVFVKSREFGQMSGCGFFQGECANAMALPLLRDELIHRCGEGNFAKRVFHENFPDGNRTQQYFLRGVGKYLLTHRRERFVVRDDPQKCAGIQQNLHLDCPEKALSRSSGRGSKKLSGMVNWPLAKPMGTL